MAISAQKIAEKLGKPSRSGKGWKCLCPAHEDENPSFIINDDLTFHCFAGCSKKECREALEGAELLEPEKEIVYTYHSPDGEELFQKVRRPGKQFHCRSLVEGVEVRSVAKFLYNAQEIHSFPEDIIFVVEGERDAIAIEFAFETGVIGTCNFDGAGKWRAEYTQQLKGRNVVIIPDYDEPGYKHAKLVESSLDGHAASVTTLDIKKLFESIQVEPQKGYDISDWFDAGGTAELLLNFVEAHKCQTLEDDTLSDIKAEHAILACILSDNELLANLDNTLTPEDFFNVSNRIIFRSMLSLLAKNENIDSVMLHNELKQHNLLDRIGGDEYLSLLNLKNANILNFTRYVGIVRTFTTRRAVVQKCAAFSDLAKNYSGDVDELLDEVEAGFSSLRKNVNSFEVVNIKELTNSVVEKIEEDIESGVKLSGLSTGLTCLDDVTSGLECGELFILAARPSMGKTSLALNIAEFVVLKLQEQVMLFSLEMAAEQLIRRLLCSLCSVDSMKLKTNQIDDKELESIKDVAKLIANSGLVINDNSSGISILQLKAKARAQHRKNPLSLVIVDYIQLMKGSSNSERREREIAEISLGLKALAIELDIPVLALSQLNRSVEARTDKRPYMSDLRESGAIEQDADMIGFVYRDEVYNPETLDKGLAELIIAKNRNGAVGNVKLRFEGPYMRFRDVLKPSLPPTPNIEGKLDREGI